MRLPEFAATGLDYQAFQFRAANSPIHRLGTGWKLFLWIVMSTAAFSAQKPWPILALVLLNTGYYLMAGLGMSQLWKDVRFFIIQTFVIVGLYELRYGIIEGLWPGFRTGFQVMLFFIPGTVFLRTTQGNRMRRDLRRFLPASVSFLIFTCLRFVPFFAREMREISMIQQIRGARLAPRHWVNPRNWKDIHCCLIMPLIVRALKTANEAALSAEARAINLHAKSFRKEKSP